MPNKKSKLNLHKKILNSFVTKPWGSVTNYVSNLYVGRVSVKILTIEKGSGMPLQSHQYRDELWVVMSDDISVITNDSDSSLCKIGDIIIVPRGIEHKAWLSENSESDEGLIVEISFGKYNEDDVE